MLYYQKAHGRADFLLNGGAHCYQKFPPETMMWRHHCETQMSPHGYWHFGGPARSSLVQLLGRNFYPQSENGRDTRGGRGVPAIRNGALAQWVRARTSYPRHAFTHTDFFFYDKNVGRTAEKRSREFLAHCSKEATSTAPMTTLRSVT